MKSPSGLSYMTREDANASGSLPIGELPRIFISYKKHEKKQVTDEGLIYTRDLAAKKLISLCDCAVWHDEFLTPGGDYNAEIASAITECDAMVLLLTANVLDSTYIWQKEIELAKKNRKTIIPIAFDFSRASYGTVESRLGGSMHIISWPGGDDDASQTESEFNDALTRALEQLTVATSLTQEITKIAPVLDEGVPLSELSLRNWYLIGRACLEGIRVEKNVDRGRRLLDAVVRVDCADDDVTALRCQAANALFSHHNEQYRLDPEKNDFAPCREYAKIGVELGDGELTYRRGYMYRKGRGAGRDPEQAAKLFERAAQLGNVKAMTALGVMLRSGEGTAKNTDRAFKLLSAAARQGNGEAMWNLAQMYDWGEGTVPNEALAEEWHIKAAEINGGYSMRKLGEKYDKEGNVAAAYKWYHNSAAQGDGIAMRNLGDMYRKGIHVSKDMGKAFGWYYRSAAVGNFVAMRYLGLMFCKGMGVEADQRKAHEWFKRSVELGGVRAAGSLARMYWLGEDLPQDKAMSAYWYRAAADLGSTSAAEMLARLQAECIEPAQPDAMPVQQTAEPVPAEISSAVEQEAVSAPAAPLSPKEAKAALKLKRAEEKKAKKEEKAALKQAAKEAKRSRRG